MKSLYRDQFLSSKLQVSKHCCIICTKLQFQF